MKLNQQELTSLALKIIRDIQEKATAAQKAHNEACDSKNLKVAEGIRRELLEAEKAAKAIQKSLSVKTRRMGQYIEKKAWNRKEVFHFVRTNVVPTVEQLLERMRTWQTTVTEPESPHYRDSIKEHDIYHDLVIAQIDAANVEDLIAKVTANYVK